MKSLKARGTLDKIELSSGVPYASIHEEGGGDGARWLKAPHVQASVDTVLLGGEVRPRPFMVPSEQILNAPKALLEDKMKTFGWST